MLSEKPHPLAPVCTISPRLLAIPGRHLSHCGYYRAPGICGDHRRMMPTKSLSMATYFMNTAMSASPTMSASPSPARRSWIFAKCTPAASCSPWHQVLLLQEADCQAPSLSPRQAASLRRGDNQVEELVERSGQGGDHRRATNVGLQLAVALRMKEPQPSPPVNRCIWPTGPDDILHCALGAPTSSQVCHPRGSRHCMATTELFSSEARAEWPAQPRTIVQYLYVANGGRLFEAMSAPLLAKSPRLATTLPPDRGQV